MTLEQMIAARRAKPAVYVGGGPHPAALLVGIRPPVKPKAPKTKLIRGVPETNRQRATRIFGDHCFFCGLPFAGVFDPRRTFDHFIPVSRGGKHRDNLVPACGPCNRRKANRLPTEEEREKFQNAVLRATT